MKKVRKNAHKKIEAILNSVTEVKVYTLNNYFKGEVIGLNKEYITNELTSRSSYLMDNENGTYTLHIHSNCWYTLSTEVIETVEEIQAVEVVEAIEETEQVEPIEATYKLNEEKNGVEIYFSSIPSVEIREQMKAIGFRWAKYNKCWYSKQSETTINFAKGLCNKLENNEKVETIVYDEINIDDIETYTIDQSLQDREHDSGWIFRQNKRDHNKEIQELFTNYTNEVKDILTLTNNEYYIYKLKSGLQRFKKKYHSLYIKYLTHKANNPSWAVTGRGNLNISKYNNAMQRQNNIMLELADLPKQFEREINKYRNKIKKERQAS